MLAAWLQLVQWFICLSNFPYQQIKSIQKVTFTICAIEIANFYTGWWFGTCVIFHILGISSSN